MPWFRGDCHIHSILSHGGELTPAQLTVAAHAAGLDFLAVTEHNTPMAYADWAAEDIMVIPGMEVTTPRGHWLEIGSGGLRVAAHPYAPYPSGRFEYPLAEFDAVEVWNGPWQGDQPWNADNEAALAEWAAGLQNGRRQPAIGNSDTHLAGQTGVAQTIVRASELSPAAIAAGLRAGHSWLAESAGVQLSLTASAGGRRVGIGDRLVTDGEPATIGLEVDGVPSGGVSLHTDQGIEHRAALPECGSAVFAWLTAAAFVRVEVRHPGGRMAALTNPVFLN